MAKYEIMLVLDPKKEIQIVKTIFNDVFKQEPKDLKILDQKDLAYKINDSMTGTFILIHLETEGSNIQEWNRKINITKSIWRNLVINLDNESNYGKPFVENRFSKYPRLRSKQKERKKYLENRKFERNAAASSPKIASVKATNEGEVNE